jgi:anti-sigma factor RsiW
MNRPDELWKIDAFVDGELDLAGRLDLERQMGEDAALRERVETVRALRDAVRERAARHAAPAALRARIAALGAPAQRQEAHRREAQRQETQRPERREPRPIAAWAGALQRWLAWPPLATIGFAALIAVVSNLVWLQSSSQQQLMEEAVGSHVRSTVGTHLVDVAASDHHTVKPFLSARLGFSPPVDSLQVPGSVLVGGRVDYLAGQPVAALVYRQGDHIVNSFVWPGGGTESRPVFSSKRGFLTAHWREHGMNHCVVSDVNPEEFRRIVAAVQQIDAAPR